MSSNGITYQPTVTEHDGLRKDGQPDQRVNTGEFAGGKVDPNEAGKKGGETTGTSSGGASGASGRDSGSSGGDSGNSGGSAKGQFAHGKVDHKEVGKKGRRFLSSRRGR